jgi:hypothetical protein
VREGVTGFLVEDVNHAVAALRDVSNINPWVCVQRARENFSAMKMAERYSELYVRLVQPKKTVRLPKSDGRHAFVRQRQFRKDQ